jgi:hypothetical protein
MLRRGNAPETETDNNKTGDGRRMKEQKGVETFLLEWMPSSHEEGAPYQVRPPIYTHTHTLRLTSKQPIIKLAMGEG